MHIHSLLQRISKRSSVCYSVSCSLLAAFQALHDGTFAGAVWRMECICESTRLRLLGEKEAAGVKCGVAGGVELDVERVWLAVDLLKNAAVESRGQGLTARAPFISFSFISS